MIRVISFACCCLTPLLSLAQSDTRGWFKGNTHAHSLWSDGNDFPEMIVDWYQRHGYQFIALSDHDILAEGTKILTIEQIKARQRTVGLDAVTKCERRFGSEWIERRMVDGKESIVLKTLEQFRGQFEQPGKFFIMTAEEISNASASGPVHINALNLKDKIPPIKDKTMDNREVIRRTLEAVADQEKRLGRPILAHINHPNFQWALTAEDIAAATGEVFFEVYNGHPGINHLGKEGRPGDERIWDIANTIRLGEMGAAPLFGVATDDSHTYHGGDVSPGRGWIMVGAEKLDGDSLIIAMREGRFYASTGVYLEQIDYDAKTRRFSFTIQPDGEAAFDTQIIGSRKGPPGEIEIGEVLARFEGTSVAWTLPDGVLYARATVTSSRRPENPSFPEQKKQAWLQPVGWKIAH